MDERDDAQKHKTTWQWAICFLINAIVAGDRDEDWEAEERQDCVDRNVAHLEIMVAKKTIGVAKTWLRLMLRSRLEKDIARNGPLDNHQHLHRCRYAGLCDCSSHAYD